MATNQWSHEPLKILHGDGSNMAASASLLTCASRDWQCPILFQSLTFTKRLISESATSLITRSLTYHFSSIQDTLDNISVSQPTIVNIHSATSTYQLFILLQFMCCLFARLFSRHSYAVHVSHAPKRCAYALYKFCIILFPLYYSLSLRRPWPAREGDNSR